MPIGVSSSNASSSPHAHGGNVLLLMQQLRDTQQAQRAAEARCEVLEDENRRLRSELNRRNRERENRAIKPSLLEVAVAEPSGSGAISSPVVTTESSSSAGVDRSDSIKDRLISELQLQLTDVLRRNTKLEAELHSQHSGLRHQYEAHVDRLEFEIRRAKAQYGGAIVNNGESALRSSPPSSVLLRSGMSASPQSRRDLI